ncbi:MAG: hypothetical protein ABWX76_12900 [Leifsonia flava]
MPVSKEILAPHSSLTPGSVLAGYRVIRQIPGEAGQESWLAVTVGEEAPPCVLTFCADDEAGRRRLSAHETVRSPHVLALLDVATDAEGRILLATERTDWTVATLIASRATIAAGEAVTVLAPLTAGLAAVHAAGFVHRLLGPASVLFTANGRPVLGRLDGVVPDAIRTRDADDSTRFTAGAIADYRALAGVVRAVADRVEEQTQSHFLAIADWLEAELDENAQVDALPAQLECRIFAEAAPLPLVLVADRPAADPTRGVSAGRRRVQPLPRAGPRGEPAAGPVAGRGVVAALRRLTPGPWLRRVLHGRVLAVCLGIVVLVIVVSAGLSAIPDTTTTGRPATGPPTRDLVQERRQTPSAAVGTAFTTSESAAVGAADPAAAASALLALRARCAAVDAAQCVSRFAEPGSALDAADRQAFTGDGSGALLIAEESRVWVDVVQDYGDAVLTRAVATDEKRHPVHGLGVRTDTGWRLRDVFEPD